MLAAPGAEHTGAEPLPGPGAVQSVVPAAVGLAGVLGAATAVLARQDTADRAEPHHPRLSARKCTSAATTRLTLVTLDSRLSDVAMSVVEADAAVYSPAVLRLGAKHVPLPR